MDTEFRGARSRLDEKLKKWEGAPVVIPPPHGYISPKEKFKRPNVTASRNYRKKEIERSEEKKQISSVKEENKSKQDKGDSTSKDTLRIKRKRDEQPIDIFVLDQEQERKKVKKPLSSLVEKFAALDSSIADDVQKLKQEEKEDEKEKKIQERKLFRFAYTITDVDKLKQNMRGARKILEQNSRQKTVAGLRKPEKKEKDEDQFVIDVYLRDHKPADAQELDQARVIRLESFDEDLIYENEYDKNSDGEDEDVNAEDHPWNDYPEEEGSIEFSDDESDLGEEGGEGAIGTQELSSDDEGFRPYEYSSEEEYGNYAHDDPVSD